MTKLNWRRTGFVVLLICALTPLAAQGQDFNTVIIFHGTNGSEPSGGLAQGTDGHLYGATDGGGANQDGTIFKVNSQGVLTTLYSFCSRFDCTDGLLPGGLVLATDGSFYGITYWGGTNFACYQGCGTVFKITPTGTFTTLYNFCSQPNCIDGAGPDALIQAANGKFYGTTDAGGASSAGTVFEITAGGELKTLYSFCSLTPRCTDGAEPSGLVQASDGNFYGTTVYGGEPPTCPDSVGGTCGTIFRLSSRGRLRTLHSFHGPDGAFPQFGLIQATDGSLYGTATDGGADAFVNMCGYGCGTVFKVTLAGAFSVLHSFDTVDGANPQSRLVEATDGNLFGTTWSGGDLTCHPQFGCGTVFRITPSGMLTTLHEFQGGDGEAASGLIQATDGVFYGATVFGGGVNGSCENCGTIYSLNVGLVPFVGFVQAAGRVGETAQILGQGFEGTTAVSFNGVPANFKVRTNTFLTATVPQGATTGYVTVTTPSGVLKSNVPFHVIP